MKKFFARLHLWLAIPFGLVVTILCLTGAILVFESELKEWTQPSLYRASDSSGERLPFGQIIGKAKEQLPDTVGISSIQVPSSPGKNFRLGVAGERRTSILVDPYTGEVKGVVRPYEKGSFFTVVRRLHRWFLLEVRREGISWGKMITGVTTLVFVFILISGIIIWIPKTIKGLKKRFTIKTGAGKFRFWYDFHLSLGKTASLLLLAMALTGLTWSFNWYRNGFYKVFGVEIVQQAPAASQGGAAQGSGSDRARDTESEPVCERPDRGAGAGVAAEEDRPENRAAGHGDRSSAAADRSGRQQRDNDSRADAGRHDRDNAGTADEMSTGGGHSQAGGDAREQDAVSGVDVTTRRGGGRPEGAPGRGGRGGGRTDYAVWETVATQLMEANPRFRAVTVQDGSVSVSTSRYGNTRASDSYKFDPRTGTITEISYYKDQPKSAKIRGWIYAVHVGSWGGIFTKILYFLACLVGAALPLTGYYIWLKKRWKKWMRKKTGVA